MKNKLAVCAALCAMFAMLFASQQVVESCRCALQLCLEMILPTLFPFFVISILLSRLGFPALLGRLIAPAAERLFGISGTGASALVIGLTGGYPLGAAYIADMERSGAVSAREAERLLAFCNNSGPAFIIGAIGVGVFGSASAGLLLYAMHACAAVGTGLLLRHRRVSASERPPSPAAPAPVPLSRALPDAVSQAVVSVLSVCGFVVCFSAFTGLLDANGFFSAAAGRLSLLLGTELHWTRALLCGLLELGSGAGAMRGLSLTPLNAALAAGLLSWGGISVHLQTLALLADSEIKGALHTAGRLVSALLAAALAYVFTKILF
ncbi:MAG: sporulation protein [Oscillospiraceae bacterium]|nr:sporulation protein [Oscillospiraceae bacterium]